MSPLRTLVVAVAVVAGQGAGATAAFSQPLAPRESGADLSRALQVELAGLSERVGALLREGTSDRSALQGIAAALDRVRAADMLIAERDLQLEQRLEREGASAPVRHRQRENARLVREGLDRLYAAAAPLRQQDDDTPLGPEATRSMLETLASALTSSAEVDRTPLSVTLPHRSLLLPQIAPTGGAAIVPAYLQTNPVPPAAADTRETTEASFGALVRAKAFELSRDPIALFDFVQNEIATDFYYGSMHDASETLRQASGNDIDQASLLIALLRSSGVPARYVRGVVVLTGAQAMAWTGAGSARRAAEVFTRAGMPFRPVAQGGAIAAFEIEHTWVEAYVSYSNYRGAPLGATGRAWIALDPSFKTVEVTPGEDVSAGMGVTADQLIADYLSSPQTQAFVEFYQARITEYLADQRPDLTLEQALATLATRQARIGLLPNTLPYDVLAVHAELTEIPDSLKHRVRFTAGGEGGVSFDVTIPSARLSGRRLTLSYVPATVDDQNVANAFLGLDSTPAFLVKLRPVLKVDGVVQAAGATPIQMGLLHSFTVEIQSPRQTVPIANAIVAGGYYAIGLGSGGSRYQTPGVRAPDDTEHPAADRLYTLASTYHAEWREAEGALARILRTVTVRPMLGYVMVGNAYTRTLLFGQPQAIDWRGVFVDADLHVAEAVPIGADNARAAAFMRLSGVAGSMLEGDVLQQDLGVDAVSAARLIQLARAEGVPVDEITAANAATALPLIQTAAIVKTEIADAVNQGWRVTIPRRDLVRHAWSGIGYIMLDPVTGSGGYFISGGFAGAETTQTPEEWAREIAEQLGTPYQDDPNSDPTAAQSILKVLISDGQRGRVGEQLPQPIAVWVRDAEGRPVEGAAVTFRIVAGGGRFTNASDTIVVSTNRQGIGRVNPQLGQRTAVAPFYVNAAPGDEFDTLVGENLIMASVQGSGGQIPIDAPFQLFAFPGPPAALIKVLAPEGLIPAGTAAGTLRARVVDAFENPVSNVVLNFEVQPAVPRLGPLPASAINLQLYRREECAIPAPLLGDCPGSQQFHLRTSLWGAQVETILGDTIDTKFRVRVSTNDLSPDPGDQRFSTEFELSSAGTRDYNTTSYTPPTLIATLLALVNDRGELVNAAEVDTQLPKPLEVVIAVLEDDYRVESTGAPCLPAPAPECFRVVSLQTTRVRPIDIGREGKILFAGPDGSVIEAQKAQESVRITFAFPAGSGSVSPPIVELPEHGLGRGRYESTITVGPQPALNRFQINPTANLWVPAFDLRSDEPVVPAMVTLRPGERVTGADFSVSPPLVRVGPADFYPANLEHDVFGVRARILAEERVLVGEAGGAITDVDVEYLIEPASYDADLAQIDLLEGGDAVSATWKGFLPGTATTGEGHGRIHRGSGGFGEHDPFDATKQYFTRLVLNRGGAAEIKSDATPLRVYLAGPLGVDFRSRENTARESRRKAVIPLEDGLWKEKANLTKLIATGLTKGQSCGVPIAQIAILEQGSGACFWSERFNFGDRDRTPPLPPDPVGACSGFQPGISDHDYEVLIPDSVPSASATCLVNALNQAAEDPQLELGDVSFFRVSMDEVVNGKLNIDPPAGGGSDAVGDVGLGRQTLLFKWALEGEWVTALMSRICRPEVQPCTPIDGLQAPEVTIDGQRVPLLDHVINTLRTTETISGELTGIPTLEGLEWGVLQHFNFYKSGAHVGLTGNAADPKSHLYALRQVAVHNAAKAGIRAATGRLIASESGNLLLLDVTRAQYRAEGGCLTGALDPSNPPALADLFPKPCDSFEEHVASTAIRDYLRTDGADRVFNADEIATIYQFYRIKEDVACAAAGCQTEITDEADANRFVAGALKFIDQHVVRHTGVKEAYDTVIKRPDSEAAKRLSNRARADAGRAEAAETVSYVLEARVFNDNDLELRGIPLNMYPQPPPDVSYPVPRIVGRSSPAAGEVHDPRWTDTIVDVKRNVDGDPIPDPEDGKPQPVFEWDIAAGQPHASWFVLDPLNAVNECNKDDNTAGFIAYPIDMDNPGSIPDLAGVPRPPLTVPASPAECATAVPSLRVTKLVNDQAEITVAARTPVTVRNVITNTGAVPLHGVQVVDLLLNRTFPPFSLAAGESVPLEGQFQSPEPGKLFVGPTEVLAFVPETIIPGGKTISAWDSVRVNVVAPSCAVAVAPPTPDPNRYTTDGRPVSTVMQGGTVYRYFKAYGAAAGSIVELLVDDEPLQAFVDSGGNVAHYASDPDSPTGAVRLFPGLEIPHTLIGTRGTYTVRFVTVGGSRSVCSEPFEVEVTNREFTRGFEAGGAIDAAGTILVGISGKAGASLDIKITEQLGPTRSKLAISRSMNGKLGVQAGISSPKFKVVLPGVRAQIGASAEAAIAGLVMGGDTHEFKYQPNSIDLEQADAAALGALMMATAADRVPVVGKIVGALVGRVGNLDQYRTADTVSMGLQGKVGAEVAGIAGLAAFNKEDNRSLGQMKYGLGLQGSLGVTVGGTVSLDSKPLAGELVPGFKVNMAANLDVSGGFGDLSDGEEIVDHVTEEKAAELKKKLKGSLKASVAGSKGAKLTLDANDGYKPKKLTFSVAPKKSYGWEIGGEDYTPIEGEVESDDVTFTYTFTDPDMLAKAINQLSTIRELVAIGGVTGTGAVLGPLVLVQQLHGLWVLAAQHDGSYEAVTKQGHPTEIPLELALGAGASVKVSGAINFDRSIAFHSEKGVIKAGVSYPLETYTDDQWIPDLQDLEDVTDLIRVWNDSASGLLDEIGPVVDVVQQAVTELVNVVRSNNTAQLTFDGATAPFPQIGIASYTFEATPGPIAPALQLPGDSSGPADAPHYGIGGFHQFLPQDQQLSAPGTLKIFYEDSELAGIDEQTLAVYEWNAAAGDWDHLGGTVDPVANTVTTSVRRMSLYTAAPPMPASRFSLTVHTTPGGTPNDPKTTINGATNQIRMNTGVIVPDGTLFTVRALTPQGTDLTAFGSITSVDEDPLLDGIQVRSSGGVARFTAEVPGAAGAVRFLIHAVRGTALADQIITY